VTETGVSAGVRGERGDELAWWGTHQLSSWRMVLIARGYPSIAYATFDPALGLWATLYPEVPPDRLNRAFNNVRTFGFGNLPERVWAPVYTVAPIAPVIKPGVTVCDVIRPTRAPMAASIGCPAPAAATAPPPPAGGGHD
jgi:hypothetical protein